jgi:predicted ATPase
MFALHFTAVPVLLCGDYSRATALAQELCALADEKDLPFWKVNGSLYQGSLFALTGDASNAIRMITSGITAARPTGVTAWMPRWLSYLAFAHANLGQIDDAWRCIGEAISTIETTKERWFEAETNRIAGEIALRSPEPDVAKAQTYFDRALGVACRQQAKSWELRASTSLARLWRDQGKVQQARELLAPVYGWFTEGFDTRDLKEAKALLQELALWMRVQRLPASKQARLLRARRRSTWLCKEAEATAPSLGACSTVSLRMNAWLLTA